MNAKELGYQIGLIVGPLIVIGLAVYAGRKMGQKRNPPKFVAWPAAVATLLVVAAIAVKVQKNKQIEAAPFGQTR